MAHPHSPNSIDDFTPAITVQSFRSAGVRYRPKGRKSGRIHHLLSTLEYQYFLCLDFSPLVTRIREQYPLPLLQTQDCARRLQLRHPWNQDAHEAAIMTTDFLVDLTMPNGATKLIARSTKYTLDAAQGRAREKLEIERLYWNDCNVDWGLITERSIPPTVVANARWLDINGRDIDSPPAPAEMLPHISATLRESLSRGSSLGSACSVTDRLLKLPKGSCLGCVRFLINNGEWCVDISQPIRVEAPLIFLDNDAKGGA
ncbi:TnsA endonuclease N-terminal domain-containing protein [Janthinobacterium sp.]|uniref:TnsA endonuclease N-terminal domain-containing protein n=1 Tax=Janthinobacterium sp. TaxID=1871054 RepID=UPI00293D5832|nr:TnsA endonuclease N-terminal domain-containing protein [Janthinobacterium sp.]